MIKRDKTTSLGGVRFARITHFDYLERNIPKSMEDIANKLRVSYLHLVLYIVYLSNQATRFHMSWQEASRKASGVHHQNRMLD